MSQMIFWDLIVCCWYESKGSITFSEKRLSAIDERSSTHKSRSDIVEHGLWTEFNHLIRQERNRIDLALINDKSDMLNEEAKDVLEYQGTI